MKVVLHICCAVCGAGAAERLIQEGHQVQGFFYNPNIFPEEEYRRRLINAQKVAQLLGFSLIEGPCEPDTWSGAVAGLENEPEGGKRCPVCYRIRLEKTYQIMLNSDCEAFTTTLTMGSNKSAEAIGQIGCEIGGDQFLKRDFKKKEGFRRAVELACKWELYRSITAGVFIAIAKRDRL